EVQRRALLGAEVDSLALLRRQHERVADLVDSRCADVDDRLARVALLVDLMRRTDLLADRSRGAAVVELPAGPWQMRLRDDRERVRLRGLAPERQGATRPDHHRARTEVRSILEQTEPI